MQLTQQQIDDFFQVGYTLIPDLLSGEEIALLDEALQELQAIALSLDAPTTIKGARFVVERLDGANGTPLPPGKQRPSHRIHRIQWAGAATPLLSHLGSDPRLKMIAATLLAHPQMDQIINQVHFKFPFDGVAFPWHQDSQFRRYGTELWDDINGKGSFVQIAIAVDDMTLDNGPLQFIPGSCRWGHLGLDKLAREATNNNDAGQLTVAYELPPQLRDKCRVEDAVSIELPAGSAVAFGPYTIHRSLPNEGSTSRRVFINGYAYPDANKREYPGAGTGVRLDSAKS